MKLNAILHALLPRDYKFLPAFEKIAENVLDAARTLEELMTEDLSKEERIQKIRKIEEIEHKGDAMTHQILNDLSATFVTPLDREDIHALATSLDDVLDYIQGTSKRLELYRLKKLSGEMKELATMIYGQVKEISKMIPLLHNMGNDVKMRESIILVNSLENEADDIFERAVARLFEDCDDPIQLIKIKEVLVSLETATDLCEDVANVIENVLIKNA